MKSVVMIGVWWSEKSKLSSVLTLNKAWNHQLFILDFTDSSCVAIFKIRFKALPLEMWRNIPTIPLIYVLLLSPAKNYLIIYLFLMWKPHEHANAMHCLFLALFPVYGLRIESSCYEFFIAIAVFGSGRSTKLAANDRRKEGISREGFKLQK